MSSSLVTFEAEPSGVGVVAMLDAAGGNAMNEPFVRALEAALAEAVAWPGLKVVLLVGLPEVFSTGASIDMLRSLNEGARAPADLVLARALFDVPVPVVAAMEGMALGGGLALGASADIVVIARESRYGAPFMNLGFTPGMGMTRVLQHVMSPALAAELLFTGEPKKGAWFEGKSGFNAILPRAEVRARALAIAERIAEKPRTSLELLKRTLTLSRRQSYEQTHTIENLMHLVTFPTPEVRARVDELVGAAQRDEGGRAHAE